MTELNVLELVEAFNQAKAALESANADKVSLAAEVGRLEPFEAQAEFLANELEVSKALHAEASTAGTAYAAERDAAIAEKEQAEKERDISQKSFEDANAALAEVQEKLAAAEDDIKELEGQVRTLSAFEKKARPVFEATEGLKAALASF